MNLNNRIYAKIDLDAVRHNLDAIHKIIKPGTKVMAVIKTDAYGHGALPIADVLEQIEYVYGYAVATAEEALALRGHGIQKPILILGYVFAEHYPQLIAHDIRLSVFTMQAARQLSETAQALNKDVFVHIKIDTGMSRIGMQADVQSAKLIAQMASLPHIIPEGIFTHFARADEADKAPAQKQLELFKQMIQLAEDQGVTFAYHHCANSASIIDLPDTQMELVRAGIILYGLWPSDEVCKERIDLHPALELVSHVAFVKQLEAGRSISYGGTYTAKEPRIIATIPVGYGDGYPRSLSNKGYVLIHGRKARITGRVCMDQFMVDVSDIPQVCTGDKVVLAGRDGEESLTLETLGSLSDRFNYEFACCLSKRIPRVFYENGMPLTGTEKNQME